MSYDIFFDCPQCNHTIKASSELIGIPVECPDCGNEFPAPDVRDGLNPRLRSEAAPVSSAVASVLSNSGVFEELTHLENRLRLLLRQQQDRVREIDLLEGRCTVAYKQVQMMKRMTPSAVPEPPEISPAEEGSLSPALCSRLSWICCGLSLAVALGTLIAFFAQA